jgi:hypothetical protein
MARQRLGQHFLADANWREQIARAIAFLPTPWRPAGLPKIPAGLKSAPGMAK